MTPPRRTPHFTVAASAFWFASSACGHDQPAASRADGMAVMGADAAPGASVLAATPPMGWNTWYGFHCMYDEQSLRDTADALLATGLRDLGYQNLILDDCWQTSRDASGVIVADPTRFPSGIQSLADYVHARGLKLGIYTDAGSATCV